MKKTVRKTNLKAELKPAKAASKGAIKKALKANTSETEILNLTQIKELIELIAEKQFTEFELERGKFRMRLGRGGATKMVADPIQYLAVAPEMAHSASVPPPVTAVAQPLPNTSSAASQADDLHIITSPIVGTFYRASSPTTAAFVSVGDMITEGKTLCIIEAMKLMNEINADVSGTVAKIFVENAQPVEYGQPLFGIKV